MCEAGTAAVIVAIVGAAANAAQDADTKRKQKNFQQRKEIQERRNALRELAIITSEVHEQQKIDQQAASQAIDSNSRAASAAISRATVTAGEVGAFGASYQALVSEFAQQESEFTASVYSNLATKNQLAALNLQSGALAKDTRLYNAQAVLPSAPNFVGHAVQGIGAGFQLYSGFKAVGAANKPKVSVGTSK